MTLNTVTLEVLFFDISRKERKGAAAKDGRQEDKREGIHTLGVITQRLFGSSHFLSSILYFPADTKFLSPFLHLLADAAFISVSPFRLSAVNT